MFIQITQTKCEGVIRKYAKIVESYRIDGKCRHRLILNLGPVRSKDDLTKYNGILREMKIDGCEFVRLENVSAEHAKEFGVTYAVNKLFEKYGIDSILKDELSENNAKFDVYGVIKALIINRLLNPSSELAACEWIHEDYCEELDVQEHHLYRALDYLIPRKEGIEFSIFQKLKKSLNLNTDLTHYDLTSSYFEGNCCEIAMFGHSRDHRKDRKQIVIGLAMCDGIPIMHDVYRGNTVDKKTLKPMQEQLRKRLGIKKTVIVGDGGLITKLNVERLEEDEFDYLLACKRRKNSISEKLLIRQIVSGKKQFAKEIEKKEIIKGDKKIIRRYILCIDNNTKKERLSTLDSIKKRLEKKLKDLKGQYEKSQESKKGRKITKTSLILKANKILGKNKRLFDLKYDNGLRYFLNKKAWNYEKKIAGKFLLVTNTNIEANKAMKTYKELQVVENAFDEIKNFLDIRGIFHRKERRVKAHTFVCVLSFLIETLIEKFSDATARVIIRKLKRIKAVSLDVNGKKKKLITKIPKETEIIFNKLKISKPILPNY